MLGPLCNQTVNLKTDSKNLYHSVLKLKYSLSISKHNKGWKIYALLSNSYNAVEITGTVRIYLQTHMFILTDWSLDACHELVCIFKDFFASGMQDAELTKSLSFLVLLMGIISKWCNTTIEKTLYNTRTLYMNSYVLAFCNTKKYPVCPISLLWIMCLRNKIRIVGIIPWCTFVTILFA